MTHPIPRVHLAENYAASRRDSVAARAYALGEADRPSPPAGSEAIVRYLAVESSARYQRTPKATFCNIYACDYCYLARAYLPRVWWTDAALARIAAGETVPARYAETVRELDADSLYDWLVQHGPSFGWDGVATRRPSPEDALQQAANRGNVAVICAKRKVASGSGHIAMVVPELPGHGAERVDGVVRLPLQSQAGARNYRYGCGVSQWWAGAQFRAYGFFVHT